MNQIQVVKASGLKEIFNPDKVRDSLKRVGAQSSVIDKIVTEVTAKLYEGITTQDIYRQVFDLLKQTETDTSNRYALKENLMHLGPSGYPFEQFISRLLQALGYKTKTQVVMNGACVQHEIDVLAEKDKQQFLVECKFHNRIGSKTDVKAALYTQARFEDICAKTVGQFCQPWLVTNTKLTSQAIQYASCKNMRLLAWRYPETEGIETLIDKFNLYHLLKLGYSEI